MNKRTQSFVSVALLSGLAFVSLSAVQPKPAQAVVGLTSGNPIAIAIGASLTGLFLADLITVGVFSDDVSYPCHDVSPAPESYMYTCAQEEHEPKWHITLDRAARYSLFPFLIGGLIVLNDSGTASFGDLTTAQADRAALTDGERMAYASELPEINAVFQTNQAERMAEFKATGKVSVENSKADWISESGSLSPDAFSAIQKIAATVTAPKK